MNREHSYDTVVRWTGNLGTGTSGYRAYSRNSELSAPGPDPIDASSDPTFRGDAGRWNPEQLLVGALSQCHLLSFLHCCADAGVVVTEYVDEAVGTMLLTSDGGQLTRVVLRPRVTVATAAMAADAERLHHDAHAACFIARSVNFPVQHEPSTLVADADADAVAVADANANA